MEDLFGVIGHNDLVVVDSSFEILCSFSNGLELISELPEFLLVVLEESRKVPVASMERELPGNIVVAAGFLHESLKVLRFDGGFHEPVVEGIGSRRGDALVSWRRNAYCWRRGGW